MGSWLPFALVTIGVGLGAAVLLTAAAAIDNRLRTGSWWPDKRDAAPGRPPDPYEHMSQADRDAWGSWP